MTGPERVTTSLLAVLDALIAADGAELHGWPIIKTTRCTGPTVYRILERLTDMGWATARWSEDLSGPFRQRRRYYRLTDDGATRARALLAERAVNR